MSIDDDTRVAAEFAAYRERAVPTYTGKGGSAARAAVRARRARAAVAAALALLVAVGVGLLRFDRTEEDRLVPADVKPTRSVAAPLPPAGPLDDARIDFSRIPPDECGGPTVQFTDGGNDSVVRDDHPFSYYVINEPPVVRSDVTRDGRPDYVAVLGCVGEGGGVGKSWVVVLTGELPHLTVAGRGVQFGTAEDPEDILRLRVTGDEVIVTVRRYSNGAVTDVVTRWRGDRRGFLG